MLGKALEHISRHAQDRPWTVLLISALLAGAALLALSGLSLRQDLTDLLPDDVPELRGLQAVKDTIGGMDYAVIAVETSSEDSDAAVRAVDILARNLAADSTLVRKVRTGIAPEERKFFADYYLRHAFLYLGEADLERVISYLSEEGIREAVAEDARLLDSPLPNAVVERIVQDPLNLFERVFLQKLEQSFGGLRFDIQSGHFLSDDGRAALLQFWGTHTPRDVGFSQRFMDHVHGAVAAMREETGFDEAVLKVGCTGGYPVAVASQASIKRDMVLTAIGSFLCVLAVFYLAFRALVVNLTVGLPLALGVLFTFGACALFFGFEMTAISAAFGSILVGLGVDFPIHLYNRVAEEKRKGLKATDATMAAWRSTGPGVVTAGLTTAAAFFILCAASFRGLFEVGLLVGLGIVLMGGTILFVLPALLTLFEGHRPAPPGTTFGVPAICRLVDGHPRLVVATFLLLICGAGVSLANYGLAPFESDFQKLKSPMPEVEWTNRCIEDRFGMNLNPLLVVTYGASRNEALTEATKTADALRPAITTLHASAAGPGMYLPSPSRCRRNAQRLVEAVDPDFVEATLWRELDAQGFERSEFETSVKRLITSLRCSRLGKASVADAVTAGYGAVLDPFVARGRDAWASVTAVYLPGSSTALQRSQAAATFEGILGQSEGSGAIVTGMDILVSKIKVLVLDEFFPLTIVAGIVVLFIAGVHFRHPFYVACAFLPVVLGFLLTLAIMPLIDLQFNFMNIVTLPMIFGLGVDDGIHFIHRYREGGGVSAALRSAGKPIIVTSLTTMIGFGSLVAADNPGLRSIGVLAMIGIAACLICSLLFLPACLTLARRTS